ncbi:MAG TPA: RNA chaperone Hfq [Candidatus Pygmaiobacter gallistercoris]|nr:RNA chaperone Hfq [Candidatus Pygmaiobacter gallistercoris]
MINMKNLNLQDTFLNALRKERVPVTVYLLSGYQMRGTVHGFDNFVIVLDCEGKQSMVYKHAVSTITPAKNINLVQETDTDNA